MRHLLVVLSLTVLLTSCGNTPQTGVSVDRDLRRYVSPDAQAIASIQIEKLKATDLYKRHVKDLDLLQLSGLQERTGLDPRRDLKSLLLVWDGKQPVVFAKGTFDPNEPLFQGPSSSVTLVNKGLAIFGSAKPAEDGGVPSELEQQMKGVLQDAQIWEVSRGGIPLSVFPARSDVQSTLANFVGAIRETTVGVHCESGVRFHADIHCVSKEGAQRVHDAMRGLVGLARLSTNASEMDLLRLWDAVNVDQDQDMVHVRADLSPDLTEKLFTYLPRIKSRARQITKPF